MSALPQLTVQLDPAHLKLAYKAPTKGARWRTGFASLEELCRDADRAGVPAHCDIVFVETRT